MEPHACANHRKSSPSPTSTASLSSSSSKDGMSSISSMPDAGKRRERKRKARSIISAHTASPMRSPPCEKQDPGMPPPPCEKQAPATCRPAPIIRSFSADKSQFKDLVHRYTGLHCPPPRPPLIFTAPQNPNILAAAIAQSLKTLETISTYLLMHSSPENKAVLNALNKRGALTFLQASKFSQDSYNSHMGSCSDLATYNFSSPSLDGVHFKSSWPSCSDVPKPFFPWPLQNPNNNNINMSMLQTSELPHTINMASIHKEQQIAELESALLRAIHLKIATP